MTDTKEKQLNISKPPNLLVYCAFEEFEPFKAKLFSVLNNSKYTIYHLKDEMITKNPWMENSRLLIVAKNYPEEVAIEFKKYVALGGNILTVCSDALENKSTKKVATKLVENVKYREELFSKLLCDSCEDDWKLNPEAIILATIGNQKTPAIILSNQTPTDGKTVYSLLHLLRDPDERSLQGEWKSFIPYSHEKRLHILRDLLVTEFCMDTSSIPIPNLTPCYLLGKKEEKDAVLNRLRERCVGNELRLANLTLAFSSDDSPVPPVSSAYLPVKTAAENAPGFDSQGYRSKLRTQHLGQLVLFTPVVPTTMNVIQGFAEFPNAIAIARIQTQGKGRGINQWLSPEGCAMFSFPLIFPLNSQLGRRPSMVQHIVGLAVVEGILSIPGCDNLDVRVKWPNDIYVFHSKTKIGGLIVTSTTCEGQIRCIAGVGVNVSNVYPTLCLNTLLTEKNLPSVTVEDVIAASLNRLEELVKDFQATGPAKFIQQYLTRWIHSNTEVTLQSGERARVEGLDEYGFLRVRLLGGDGRELTLQPDGNSFDMMSNLIVCKENP